MAAIEYISRQNRLRDVAREHGAEVVALVPGANMVYFTGLHFHLSERPVIALVKTDGGMAFIVPELEFSKIEGKEDALKIEAVFLWNDAEGYTPAFERAALDMGLRGGLLGVDDMTMRVFEWLAFSASAPGLHVAAMGQDLLNLRAVKTPAEVELMRAANQLSEQALTETLKQIQTGMTERQLADVLINQLQAHGAEGLAFEPIVLFGERSARPHGTPGTRELREGDLVLFDFGGKTGGYPADITRTFCMGAPTDDLRAIHDTVRRANEAARAAVRPGVTCGEIDRAARAVIEEAGYGPYFIHRTGHGLGLETHELPQVAPDNTTLLAPGMVFTIEPGIYLPDVGGVRIEDNIVVTEDGGESLTSYPRGILMDNKP